MLFILLLHYFPLLLQLRLQLLLQLLLLRVAPARIAIASALLYYQAATVPAPVRFGSVLRFGSVRWPCSVRFNSVLRFSSVQWPCSVRFGGHVRFGSVRWSCSVRLGSIRPHPLAQFVSVRFAAHMGSFRFARARFGSAVRGSVCGHTVQRDQYRLCMNG